MIVVRNVCSVARSEMSRAVRESWQVSLFHQFGTEKRKKREWAALDYL